MEHNLLINNVIPASATIPAFEKLMPRAVDHPPQKP